MIKDKVVEIDFNGVTNSKPEGICDDGDVSMAFGTTSKGVVSTVETPQPTKLYNIDGCEVLLIHSGSTFKNVFVYNPTDDKVYAYTYESLLTELADGETLEALCAEDGQPTSTTVLGGIVVLVFADKCRYAYRNGTTYNVVSNKVPPLQLEVVAACRTTAELELSNSTVQFAANYPDGLYPSSFLSYYTSDNINLEELTKSGDRKDRLYETDTETFIMGKVTELIADWGHYGYFFSPVVIRAAYRLKTGELASLTNPVLCFPYKTPSIALGESADGNGYIMRGIGYKLYAKFLSGYSEKYKDLIDSIDIFISTPVYTHSTNGVKIRYEELETATSDFDSWKGFWNAGSTVRTVNKIIRLGELSDALTPEKLESVSNFYLVKSIPYKLEEFVKDYNDEEYFAEEIYSKIKLNGYRKLLSRTADDEWDIDVTSEQLATREAMTDTLRSNIESYPNGVTTYNSRLINIGNNTDLSTIETSCPKSYFSGCINISGLTGVPDVEYFNNRMFGGVVIGKTYDKSTGAVSQFFMGSDGGSGKIPKLWTCEEPNLREVKALYVGGSTYVGTFTFKEHPLLNLSIFTGEIQIEDLYESDGTTLSSAAKELVELTNSIQNDTEGLLGLVRRNDYIKISNTADPYTFESANNAFFNSEVKRIMVVPEAISLGQYGTDQMYAICADGIYTVGINQEGGLNDVNTYSQEIIVAPEKACVMKSQLLANNADAWDLYYQQKANHFLNLARNFAFRYDNLPYIAGVSNAKAWSEILQKDKLYKFLKKCRLAYDGHNNQVVAYDSDINYTALYNEDYGLYLVNMGACYQVCANGLVLVDAEHNLYDFASTELSQRVANGMVVTRAFCIDNPNSYKTVREIIIRGQFDKDKVKLVLYGTRNYNTWHFIASSKTYYITNVSGTPYKAFKLAVFTDLSSDEYISHFTVQYAERQREKLHL